MILIYAQPPAKRLLLNELKPGSAPLSAGKEIPLTPYRCPENCLPATSEATSTSASFASLRQEDTQVTRTADDRPSLPSAPAFRENGTPVEPVSMSSSLTAQTTQRSERDPSAWRTGGQSNSSRIDVEQVEHDLYYVERDSDEDDDNLL